MTIAQSIHYRNVVRFHGLEPIKAARELEMLGSSLLVG